MTIKKKHVFLTPLFIVALCFCRETLPQSSLEDMRMAKRFGAGLEVGGPLAFFGLGIDVNVTENWSVGGGIGTGIDYSTFTIKARYFLLGQTVSPFVGFGFARWWTHKSFSTNDFSPGLLRTEFINPGQDLSRGFSVWMLYPSVGAQFLQAVGFEASVEAQYLVKLFNFAGGLYAGISAHWYF